VDFFASQDLARRNTRKLIGLLALTVVVLTLAVYGVAAVAFMAASTYQTKSEAAATVDVSSWLFSYESLVLLAAVAVLVTGVVSVSSLMKISELNQGGAGVAEQLGGRRLQPGTTDLAERRILNVVEEMALASGVPVPPVYLLDNEQSINAFAAGNSIDDAVIGVNKGTIQKLNREELQGVIAHEFSHILNGDMRMSLRMVGLLYGIQAIALIGLTLFRLTAYAGHSRSSNNKNGNIAIVLMILGGGLFLVGSIGLFFARLIKASISRQREFLADASAVQFTRIPTGIAGALKMIGNDNRTSKMESPNAESISHMFFANMYGSLKQNLLATHPPLVSRIQRIEPDFNGQFESYLAQRSTASVVAAEERSTTKSKDDDNRWGNRFRTMMGQLGMPTQSLPIEPHLLIAAIGNPNQDDMQFSQKLLENVPSQFLEHCHDVYSARCIVFASLLASDEAVRRRQLEDLKQREDEPTVEETLRRSAELTKIGERFRLPIFEILQGTLVGLSKPQFQQFQETVKSLILADKNVSLFEFFLLHHLVRHLSRHLATSKEREPTFPNLTPLASEIELLLSIVARQGHKDQADMEKAFRAATSSLRTINRSMRFTGGEWDFPKLDAAVRRCNFLAPQAKKELLAAIARCIIHDGVVTVEEAELFRAIAESLDCPVPPIAATSV
jgi:Zn-dependent protease with chaperone function